MVTRITLCPIGTMETYTMLQERHLSYRNLLRADILSLISVKGERERECYRCFLCKFYLYPVLCGGIFVRSFSLELKIREYKNKSIICKRTNILFQIKLTLEWISQMPVRGYNMSGPVNFMKKMMAHRMHRISVWCSSIFCSCVYVNLTCLHHPFLPVIFLRTWLE